MQYPGDVCIREVWIAADQRRYGTNIRVFGANDHGTRPRFRKFLPVAGIGKETQRLRTGVGERRYVRDGRSRIADEFAAESSRELPQACLHKYPKSKQQARHTCTP
jgi:hypothetical protein